MLKVPVGRGEMGGEKKRKTEQMRKRKGAKDEFQKIRKEVQAEVYADILVDKAEIYRWQISSFNSAQREKDARTKEEC